MESGFHKRCGGITSKRQLHNAVSFLYAIIAISESNHVVTPNMEELDTGIYPGNILSFAVWGDLSGAGGNVEVSSIARLQRGW